MPERIQVSRAKGWRMPPNTVKVDRSTRWGNPFNPRQAYVGFHHRGYPVPLVPLRSPASIELCLDLFTAWLLARLGEDPGFLEPLRGKNLGCWCKLVQPCHADILLRVANGMPA
jgi:hypothetical protein